MIIYTLEKHFCERTGKELSPTQIESDKYICDFSGELIDSDHACGSGFYDLEIKYNNDSEEDWYYESMPELAKILGIKDDSGGDFYQLKQSLYEGKYHFLYNMEGTDHSLSLCKEWIDNIDNKKSIFYEIDNIARAFRKARYRTVCKLLKEKKYTIEELGLVLHDYE